MAYQDDNVFAKILRGELPAHRVYEDDHALAFMDIMPQVDGHTLVIPKHPAEDLFDVPSDVLANTVRVTQHVARAVRKAFDAEGVMIAQLSGPAAGQTVFHIHFHILPRRSGADFRMHARQMAAPERLAEHAERVRKALAELS
jgi:histidine triad (HIT) family protein